jgi:ribonuclease HI
VWFNPLKYYDMFVDATPIAAGIILHKKRLVKPYKKKYTCNEAEYMAIILGMEEAINRKIKRLVVYSDSLLAVEQIKSYYSIKAQNLKPLAYAVRFLMTQFDDVKIYHISGKDNPADELSRQIKDVGGPDMAWAEDVQLETDE